MKRIYLDYNASTPVDPAVIKCLLKEFEEGLGNPSSIHHYGQQAKGKLEKCRSTIARFLQVKPQEIIFTSGGSEGAALLLQGSMQQTPNGHIISSSAEHPAVFQNLKELEKKGTSVTFLSPKLWGAVQPEEIKRALRPDTKLIALMAANNETGVMTDLDAIGSIALAANIPFVVDGVAWLGKEPILLHPGVSAVFFSGHKIHAPQGIGFCVCRQPLKLTPLFHGGAQELHKRAGTENLPGIIALAEAVELLNREGNTMITHMRCLRDRLEEGVLARIPDVVINGIGPRVCNTTNISFLGVDGETLLMLLDMEGIAVSHGSACSSGALEPSRVLLEMGIPLRQAQSAIRFSVGRTTTAEEIDKTLDCLVGIVERLRNYCSS